MKKSGYVYILTSPKTRYIKIGGTEYPPVKRIKEINAAEPYRSLGPWSLWDFCQVTDWRKTEHHLHYAFRSLYVDSIGGQNELFDVAAQDAAALLESLNSDEIIEKPKVDRMFNDELFSTYLRRLFSYTGLFHWLDLQGAWTFTLFPTTAGGRYFTINIGMHEVAFSTLPKGGHPSVHMLYMDELITRCDNVTKWLSSHTGGIQENSYSSALPNGVSVMFAGDFTTALEFLGLPSVRRAIIAYWVEGLLRLDEQGKHSLFSRFHNYNAVAELNRCAREHKNIP